MPFLLIIGRIVHNSDFKPFVLFATTYLSKRPSLYDFGRK